MVAEANGPLQIIIGVFEAALLVFASPVSAASSILPEIHCAPEERPDQIDVAAYILSDRAVIDAGARHPRSARA
jgi:hypothetical protein